MSSLVTVLIGPTESASLRMILEPVMTISETEAASVACASALEAGARDCQCARPE
jgi:hypothetical protein